MKYDLYLNRESKLASPNAYWIYKMGVASLVMTLLATFLALSSYYWQVYDVELGSALDSETGEVILRNTSMKLFDASFICLVLEGLHYVLIGLAVYLLVRVIRRNESSFWTLVGLILIVFSAYHTIFLESLYGIELSPIESHLFSLKRHTVSSRLMR